MYIHELSNTDVARLLRGPGVRARMGPFVFGMKTSLSQLVDPIHLLYANYPLEPEEDFIDFEVAVSPRSWRERWLSRNASFIIDGEVPSFPSFERSLALPMFEWAVNWCVFTRPHQYLILHSAVVERNGHAVILPGQPGAGKSTLCAGLSLRGWRLLSDEVCVMRPPCIDLIPVPRPIGLKEESINVIRAFEPGVVMGPATPGTRKGTVAHIQVDAKSVAAGQVSAKPRLIVFPSYRAGVGLSLEPISKAQTLLRIAQDAFNFSVLGAQGFDNLAALVDASDCFALTYSSMDQAIEKLNELIELEPTQPKNEMTHHNNSGPRANAEVMA